MLALLCDSTKCRASGIYDVRADCRGDFDRIFSEHTKSRLIIATFASNVDRVQQIINSANKYKRKVCLEGRSMINVIGTAIDLGYIDDPGKTLITMDELNNFPPEKTVLVTTGSQGESMAALSRMGRQPS